MAVLVVGALSTGIHERAEIIKKHNACRGERFTFQNARTMPVEMSVSLLKMLTKASVLHVKMHV